MKNISVIAFDADDTLWVNEPYFQATEKEFCNLLADFAPVDEISKTLLKTEMDNLNKYGFGTKSFTLSMIETALKLSDNKVDGTTIQKILNYGKDQLSYPIEILPGVKEVLDGLYGQYTLVMATKGDLIDQERKLCQSGLHDYFNHIAIMSDKKPQDYNKLLKQINYQPEELLMVGNSLKSDILPVLELGGKGAYIPYHVTWAHEMVEENVEHENFISLNKITDILSYLCV